MTFGLQTIISELSKPSSLSLPKSISNNSSQPNNTSYLTMPPIRRSPTADENVHENVVKNENLYSLIGVDNSGDKKNNIFNPPPSPQYWRWRRCKYRCKGNFSWGSLDGRPGSNLDPLPCPLSNYKTQAMLQQNGKWKGKKETRTANQSVQRTQPFLNPIWTRGRGFDQTHPNSNSQYTRTSGQFPWTQLGNYAPAKTLKQLVKRGGIQNPLILSK